MSNNTNSSSIPDFTEVEIRELQDEIESLRHDNALQNIHTGLGIPGVDKLASTSVGSVKNLTESQLSTLYRSNNQVANLVNLLADAFIQEWVEYEARANSELTSWMQNHLDDLAHHFNEAVVCARLYGGSALIIYANDGVSNYSKPLNESKIKTIEGYNILSSEDIKANSWNNDPTSIDYGNIETWKIQGSTSTIHKSRLVTFDGAKLPRRLRRDRQGWGDSVVIRAIEKLINLDQSDNAVANSLQTFNQTILFIHELSKKIAAGKREQVKEHIRIIAFLQSVLGILALDAEHERYEIKSRSYAGLPEVMEHVKQMAAGACDIPLTQLLNRSPSGVTSGRSERDDWARYVASRQKTDIKPQLVRIIDLLHRVQDNPARGVPPESYKLVFPSIHKLTELEKAEKEQKEADTKLKEAQRINLLIQSGVLDPMQVAEAFKLGVPIEETINLAEMVAQHTAPEPPIATTPLEKPKSESSNGTGAIGAEETTRSR